MQNTRRKLLKGSAAAPLIFTVQPAAATARTSIACMSHDQQKPMPGDVLAPSGSADQWLRKNIHLHQLTISDNGKPLFLKDRYFVRSWDNSSYWELKPGNPFGAMPAPSPYRFGQVTESSYGERMALIQVDDKGNPIGWLWEPKGGQKCTKSCWTSIKAAG